MPLRFACGLRRVRPASCTSAMPGRRCSTGCSRAGRAAPSSCASRTPTSSDRRANPSRPSSKTCGGWGWTGTRAIEKGGEHGPYRQSERLHIYRAHIVELLSRGLAYRCFCLPEQLEMDRYQALRERRPPKYVGRCRDIPPEQAHAAGRERRTGRDPFSHSRESRGRLQRSRARRSPLRHGRRRRSGADAI